MLPLVGALGLGFACGIVLTGLIAMRMVGLLHRHMVKQVEACDRSLVGITLRAYDTLFHIECAARRTTA